MVARDTLTIWWKLMGIVIVIPICSEKGSTCSTSASEHSLKKMFVLMNHWLLSIAWIFIYFSFKDYYFLKLFIHPVGVKIFNYMPGTQISQILASRTTPPLQNSVLLRCRNHNKTLAPRYRVGFTLCSKEKGNFTSKAGQTMSKGEIDVGWLRLHREKYFYETWVFSSMSSYTFEGFR